MTRVIIMGGRNQGKSLGVIVISALMNLWGWPVVVYPWLSCQYWCTVYPERGIYCAEACYALDGFDVHGNPYPPDDRS